MRRFGKQLLSFICAFCMLLSSVGDLSLYALAAPVEQTREITASDAQTYRVTVRWDTDAGIPADASLEVSELSGAEYDDYASQTAEALGAASLDYARIFDIALVSPDGTHCQPGAEVEVCIELLDDDETPEQLSVVHFADAPELLDATQSGSSVSFRTAGFSVYALATESQELVYTYYFYTIGTYGDYVPYYFHNEDGDPISYQQVRAGEKPVIPQDPHPTEGSGNLEFKGWFEQEGHSYDEQGLPVLQAQPFDFSSQPNYAEIFLYAGFAPYAYVSFHGQYEEASATFPILTTERLELVNGKAVVNLADREAPYYNTAAGDNNAFPNYRFYGWSENEVTNPGDHPNYKINEPTLEIERDKDYYPLYKKVNWLNPVSANAGTSATYLSPIRVDYGDHLYGASSGEALKIQIPERPGYEFKGWYLEVESLNEDWQNGCGDQLTDEHGDFVALSQTDSIHYENTYGIKIEGNSIMLKSNVTIYARWEAKKVPYTIVVWKQRDTDAAGIDDAEKTYDWAESFVLQAYPYPLGLDAPNTHPKERLSVYPVGNDAYAPFWSLNDPASYDAVSTYSVHPDTNPPVYTNYTVNFGKSDKDAQKVEYKGTTVFNLYYDWTGAPAAAGTDAHTISYVYNDVELGTASLAAGQSLSSATRPNDPTDKNPNGYSFGWFLDKSCTMPADGAVMPDHDLTLYGSWKIRRFSIQIDPNYGALYDENGNGTGSTFFNVDYNEAVQEYSHVRRDYVPSESGSYYYVNHNNSSYGDRKTYYTQDIKEATELTTFRFEQGTYRAAGWYKVENGTETLYDFAHQSIDSDLLLRLRWKLAGAFYLSYNPVVETETGEQLIGTLTGPGKAQSGLISYCDQSTFPLNCSADAPEGYAFVGWRIRESQDSRVYLPGETFTLPGDCAVTVNGRKTVYLDAVYEQIATARIIYHANGGALDSNPDNVDFGGLAEGATTNLEPKTAIDAVEGTATISNLPSNGRVKLSDGTGFTFDDGGTALTVSGWNTAPDGSGRHFDTGVDGEFEGATRKSYYYVDTELPETLYAEWKVKVYFDKNSTNFPTAQFGDDWTAPGYTIINDSADPHDGQYCLDTYVNALLRSTGSVTAGDLTLAYWSTDPQGLHRFDLAADTVPRTLTLYAQLSNQTLVPYGVASVNKIDWTNQWVSVDVPALTVTDALLDLRNGSAVSGDVTVPAAYEYAYACLAATAEDVGETNKITGIRKVNGAVMATANDDPATGMYNVPVPMGSKIFLVYRVKDPASQTVKIAYVEEEAGGVLATIDPVKYSGDDCNWLNGGLVSAGVLEAMTQPVEQGQTFTLKADGTPLPINQDSTATSFKMLPLLDDGAQELSLVYDKLGVGAAGQTNISSIGTVSAERTLSLRYYDQQLQWSQNGGSTWTFFSGTEATLYAVYRQRGFSLRIKAAVTGNDTGIDPETTFSVKVTSPAITRAAYSVQGTGYPTVAPTTIAHQSATDPGVIEPGVIELTVKDGSDIIIAGLASGSYTITEMRNENYELTATVDGAAASVSSNSTVSLGNRTVDTTVELFNEPQKICRIWNGTAGHYYEAYTLNRALAYARDNLDGQATIEMLRDYTIPAWDALEIPSGYVITLSTATTYGGAHGNAVIKRDETFASTAMLTNYGTLTLKDVTLDGNGGAVTSGGAMVYNENILTLEKNASRGPVLRNAKKTGSGAAIFMRSGELTIHSASFEQNQATENGGAIYLYTGVMTINDGAFTGNRANNGGAVYYAGSGTVDVSDGTFEQNVAADKGGAFYTAGGNFTFTGGTIGGAGKGNSAGNKGGAIYAENAILLDLQTGVTVSYNSAANGGAIYTERGTVAVSGGALSNNTATSGNGGAFYTEQGAVNVSSGTLTGNTANNGYGGAIYANSGSVEVSGGTFSGNSAKNGAALFIDTRNAYISGGTISGNTATTNTGGAVGVGNKSARIFLSGGVQITGNTMSGNVASNIYLNLDADDIISFAELTTGARLGIRVSEDQLSKHGIPGAKFASFTKDKNVSNTTVKNDRDTGFTVELDSVTKKLYWGKAIELEVRYQASYNNYLPSGATRSADVTYYKTVSSYKPILGSEGYAALSAVAEDLLTNADKYEISMSSKSATFGGAFIEGEQYYSNYVTKLSWIDGQWKLEERDGDIRPLESRKLIVYFAEPAYLTIENNSEVSLTISDLTMTLGAVTTPEKVINDAEDATSGYGMVFAKNGAIRSALLPVTQTDLTLEKDKAVSLLIPGGRGLNFSLGGSFQTAPAEDVSLRMGDTPPVMVPASTEPFGPYTGTTLSGTGTYRVVFGDDKNICKITDEGVEYPFPKISEAIKYAKDHSLKTVTIEMLTDYLLPASDKVEIPTGYDVTLTTAKYSAGVTYYYEPVDPLEPRATISRDSENTSSMITATSNTATTFFTLKDLIIDGKSVRGSSDGGAVSTTNCGVTVDNVLFRNVYAGNGGALYVVADMSYKGYELLVKDSRFEQCNSTKTEGTRLGGGAIHAFLRKLTLEGCDFVSCEAADQAGAVFHRIDNNYDSVADIKNCTFENCTAKAAGGMELDSKTIMVTGCTFKNCVAKERNGGGFNAFMLNKADTPYDSWITVINCKFEDCHATNLDNNECCGGAFRSTARYTTIVGCSFDNTSGPRAGAVGISSKNAVKAEIYGCTINGAVAAVDFAGAIYCAADELIISDRYNVDAKGEPIFCNRNAVDAEGQKIFEDTNPTPVGTEPVPSTYASGGQMRIENCTAATQGGAIWHTSSNKWYNKNRDLILFQMEHTTIQNCETTGNSGGAIYTTAKTVNLTDCTIKNNSAKSNGGGIYHDKDSASASLTISGGEISGNSCGDYGGGVYTKGQLTLKNGVQITGNRLTTATVANAAGVYLKNDRVLTVGEEGAEASYKDNTTVKGNVVSTGAASNLRLSAAGNGTVARATGVTVNANLTGEIRVINPGAVGDQFGITVNHTTYPIGFSEGDAVFKADTGGLYGVFDRTDQDKLIWRGDVICKLTDGNGKLLFFDPLGSDPAVFDRLDYGTDGNKASPFSYLRQDNVVLYDGSGHPFDVDTREVCVKMLVSSYDLTTAINTGAYPNRRITLTTAGSLDKDVVGQVTYSYAYRGRAGTAATIRRGSSLNQSLITTQIKNFTVKKLTLDGGYWGSSQLMSRYNGGLIHAEGEGCTVTLADNATLQNSRAEKNNTNPVEGGGGVYINGATLKIAGGSIYNCSTPSGLGGGVYVLGGGSLEFSSGVISNCGAKNGGGIYYDGKVNGLSITSGSVQITRCVAAKSGNAGGDGGGIYLANGKTLTMTGGFITGNSAANGGGGIFVGNAVAANSGVFAGNTNTRLYLSGRVTISGNTRANSAACNVEMDFRKGGNNNSKDKDYTYADDLLFNEVINSRGISRNSYIGIYIPGGSEYTGDNPASKTTTLYDRHGLETKRFGTWENGTTTNFLYCFINDRNGLKGGLTSDPQEDAYGIYWVKIFSLQVKKTVMSSSSEDRGKKYQFQVAFENSDGDPITTFADTYYFAYDQRTMVDANGETVPITIPIDSNGIATFDLGSGETVTVDGLPAEIGGRDVIYRVTEYLPAGYADDYFTTTTYESSGTGNGRVVTGKIGENMKKTNVASKYRSDAYFVNLHAVCKLTTDTSGGGLLMTLDPDLGYVPAVYSSLFDAFEVINAGTKLFYKHSFTGLYLEYIPGETVGNLYVEMLIPDYTMEKQVTLDAGKTVTLTTAAVNADDGYSLVRSGTTDTATIKRGADTTSLGKFSMFKVRGALTLKKIIIDGQKDVSGVTFNDNGSLFFVENTGSKLTVDANATLQNAKGSKGGAIHVTNGGAVEVKKDSKIKNNTATIRGAAVYVRGKSTVSISGGTIENNLCEATAPERGSGGVIYVESNGTVNISGGTIQNNECKNTYSKGTGGNGGVIYAASNATITISGGTIKNNKATGSNTGTGNGGMLYAASNATVTVKGGTIQGNTATGGGGAIYMASNGTVKLSGGTTSGNQCAGNGAGIYLSPTAKMELSGNPSFGGAAMTAGNHTTTAPNGETAPKNGGEAYATARQDIFLAETGDAPASITVTGNLKDGFAKGSIWIWAASDKHYGMQTPFATVKSGVTVNKTTYEAFRNAQTDELTLCSDGYLTGTSGDNSSYIYWTGGYEVVFKKIDGFGKALAGAAFSLYKVGDSGQPSDAATQVVYYNADGTKATGTAIPSVLNPADGSEGFFTTSDSIEYNVRFIVAPGVYVMKEETAPTGYEANTRWYRVAVGTANTGTTADFLIQRMNEAHSATEAVPDIATYGIMNTSTAKRQVLLRKVQRTADGSYQPLTDKEFDILGFDRSVVQHVDASGAAGCIWSGELPYGLYYLHEDTPDVWYRLRVSANGVYCTELDAEP